jgi:hypothetical protein
VSGAASQDENSETAEDPIERQVSSLVDEIDKNDRN